MVVVKITPKNMSAGVPQLLLLAYQFAAALVILAQLMLQPSGNTPEITFVLGRPQNGGFSFWFACKTAPKRRGGGT